MTGTMQFYLEWDKISKTHDGVQAYLDEWVYGVKRPPGILGETRSGSTGPPENPLSHLHPVDYGDY